MRLLSLICALFVVLFPLSALAQSEFITVGPTPAWVTPPEIPEATPAMLAQAQGGYLLRKMFGFSHNEPGAERGSFYSMSAIQVTERSGLEAAAAVQIDFDPLTDRVILHQLAKMRDGQILDETTTIRPEILRQERQMDIGIFTGQQTALYQIPDLRVGDVVLVAYTIESLPLLNDLETWGTVIQLGFGVPIVSHEFILDVPKGEILHQTGQDHPLISHQVQDVDSWTRYSWRAENIPPNPEEDGMPLEYWAGPTVNLSNKTDWQELSANMARKFPHNAVLPADWQTKVEAIRAAHDNDADRAFAALRLVQNDIRYVSLAYGLGGYVPRPPKEVIASGYGDCKDKSLLLMAMLDQMGIPADVALANLDTGRGLKDRLPGLYAFNHAIVRVTLHDRSVWMDPTATHEAGGLTTATRLDYGWALPLTAQGVPELERTDPGRKGSYNIRATESYEYTLLGVWLTVQSEYDAVGADSMRYSMAVDGEKSIAQDFAEYQQNRYPGIQLVGEMQFEDRAEINRVLVTERYFLPKFSMLEYGLLEHFPFGAEDYLSNVSDIIGKRRETPFFSGNALQARLRVELKGFPLTFIPPDPLTIRNNSFVYSFSGAASRKGRMTLFYRFDRTGAVVPPGDYAALIKDVRKYRDYRTFAWNLTDKTD
jgi:hypothetical protein